MTSFPMPSSRRAFLQGGGGLVVAVALPWRAKAAAAAPAVFAPNAFVRVGADDLVTVLIKNLEFGQGPMTGFATLVAEELDAEWRQIRAEHAPADTALYGNPAIGGMQATGGSSSLSSSFTVMRQAGAVARAMLVAAAAAAWRVPASEISVAQGVISHKPSGRSGRFGEFANAASKLTPPKDPVLKTPDQFIYIGKTLPKLDTKAKSTGAAVFTLDVYRDGMLTAVVEHPKKFGVHVASFDDSATRAVAGVVDVKKISSGVAVYAKNSYAALSGRKALKITWNENGAETRSSEAIAKESLDAVKKRGAVAREQGDVDSAFGKAATVLEADYLFPYLVHAPMEPLDAVIERRTDGGVEVWTGSQFQTLDQAAIAEICRLTPTQVALNTVLAGGSFGRRAQANAHFAKEAAEIFMAAGGDRPIKLMWTREDDIQGGYYRPLMAHRLRGGLSADGDIIAWEHVIAGQSFRIGTPWESLVRGGVDASMVEGAAIIPYEMPNFHCSAHIMRNPVTTLWWRSVGHTHTGYAVETFIDELLEKAGKDPVSGRLALMTDPKDARLAGVVKKVAEIAGGMDAPKGRARGIAAVESFNTFVAEIAEASIEDGLPRVHKVWCAVDCGLAVNPEIIRAQMEGGIGYSLGAVLFNELALDEGGAVAQSNFHDYRSLRINEMPQVEVAIIASDAPPSGVGEPGVPPIGPALANAVRRLTGKTPRRLPMIKNMKA
ncbi:MAG: xanthine dehydrogenase family protein molybdopterin-binding subunit [Amphiplicatus sp.]